MIAASLINIAGANTLERSVRKVLLKKLTETERGEFILRLPKDYIKTLKLGNMFVIVHRVKRFLIVESANERFVKMGGVAVKRLTWPGKGRLLRNKRLTVKCKAT